MTPDDPLQALHPLREPPPVGWWPPAPGWWLVSLLLLALLVVLVRWAWQRHRRNRYRRQAVEALQALRSAALSDAERIQQTNAILKRTALAAYPGAGVASLGGAEWLAFLQRTLPKDANTFSDMRSDIFYAREPSPRAAALFAEAALDWARRHRAEAGDA